MSNFENLFSKFILVSCTILGFLLIGAFIIQSAYINDILLLKNQYILVKIDPNKVVVAEQLNDDDYRQIMCLAKNMYFEARGEGVDGMRAVGYVTINRVLSESFPDTICAVVYQAKIKANANAKKPEDMIPYRHECQFSWFCDGKKKVIKDKEMWEEAYTTAYNMYLHYDDKNDITKGATFYHANYVKPSWRKRLQKTVSIGMHLFYRKVEYK